MSDFKREDRYIVVKLKHLAGLQQAPLRNFLWENRVPQIECVVVEHDWPEYHLVWAMIEHRMAGKPVPDFDLWRRADALQSLLTAADEELDQCQSMALMIEEKEWVEHVGTGPISSRVESAFTQMHNELSEARQGLTAADERADVLEGLLRTSLVAMSRIYSAGHDFIVGAGSDCDSVELMMENDPTAREIRAALKPAGGGGDD